MCDMKTLDEIKLFAKKHGACKAQYKKFIEFINNNDELSAWQTVLGNIVWLKKEGLKISIKKVVKKTNGVGKTWFYNGKISGKYHVNENGLLDGLYRRWWNNGQIAVESTYKEGELDGLYREWYENGKLYVECVFKDGIIVNE